MTVLSIKSLSLGCTSIFILAGCSAEPQKGPPTEQEIHANDSAAANGAPGRHPYSCDDGRDIIVDFKDQGLTVELRNDANAAPIVLTAPTQGFQYVGNTATATFSGKQITILAAGKRPVICRKETLS